MGRSSLRGHHGRSGPARDCHSWNVEKLFLCLVYVAGFALYRVSIHHEPAVISPKYFYDDGLGAEDKGIMGDISMQRAITNVTEALRLETETSGTGKAGGELWGVCKSCFQASMHNPPSPPPDHFFEHWSGFFYNFVGQEDIVKRLSASEPDKIHYQVFKVNVSIKQGFQLWSDPSPIVTSEPEKIQLEISTKRELQLWSDPSPIVTSEPEKIQLEISTKRELQLWSDPSPIVTSEPEKIQLEISTKRELQLWSDPSPIVTSEPEKFQLEISTKRGVQLWSVSSPIVTEKIHYQALEVSTKQGFQLWSDLSPIVTSEPEKIHYQVLEVSTKRELQLWSDPSLVVTGNSQLMMDEVVSVEVVRVVDTPFPLHNKRQQQLILYSGHEGDGEEELLKCVAQHNGEGISPTEKETTPQMTSGKLFTMCAVHNDSETQNTISTLTAHNWNSFSLSITLHHFLANVMGPIMIPGSLPPNCRYNFCFIQCDIMINPDGLLYDFGVELSPGQGNEEDKKKHVCRDTYLLYLLLLGVFCLYKGVSNLGHPADQSREEFVGEGRGFIFNDRCCEYGQYNGFSALRISSHGQREDDVKLVVGEAAPVALHDECIQVDLQDEEGQSLLMCASGNGHYKVVKLLLEKGAKVNLQDKNGRSALMWASSIGNCELAGLLLDHGAQVDLQDNVGQSALMYASRYTQCDVTELLLEKGADVDLQSTQLESAMSLALLEEESAINSALLQEQSKLISLLQKKVEEISAEVQTMSANVSTDTLSSEKADGTKQQPPEGGITPDVEPPALIKDDEISISITAKPLEKERPKQVYAITALNLVPLSLKTLTLIKWETREGRVCRFRLLQRTSSKWKEMCVLVDLEDMLETWEEECHGNALKCLNKVMQHWLKNGCTSTDYPVNWKGLCNLLEDAGCAEIAKELITAASRAVLPEVLNTSTESSSSTLPRSPPHEGLGPLPEGYSPPQGVPHSPPPKALPPSPLPEDVPHSFPPEPFCSNSPSTDISSCDEDSSNEEVFPTSFEIERALQSPRQEEDTFPVIGIAHSMDEMVLFPP